MAGLVTRRMAGTTGSCCWCGPRRCCDACYGLGDESETICAFMNVGMLIRRPPHEVFDALEPTIWAAPARACTGSSRQDDPGSAIRAVRPSPAGYLCTTGAIPASGSAAERSHGNRALLDPACIPNHLRRGRKGVMTHLEQQQDPQDLSWAGLAWPEWYQLDSAEARAIPREAGIYRLRCCGEPALIYIGISARLSSRLGGCAELEDARTNAGITPRRVSRRMKRKERLSRCPGRP